MTGKTRRYKIAIQGERGSFTEEAAVAYFGSAADFVTYKTLSEVFNAVEAGVVDYAVVPAENSLAGTIGETYDLLLTHSLSIVGEIIRKITHYLLGTKDSRIESIKQVWSHPQALEQARSFIERLNVEIIPKPNTAAAAKELSENPSPHVAVIASKRAAELYGLKILASNVQDNPNNYTRFFVLGKSLEKPTGNDKTSIIFSTKHEPGSLYKCLEVFAKRRINLTKIESRPVKTKPWEYYFFLDFEGHVSDEKVKEALKELAGRALFLKILGSYPRGDVMYA